MKILINPSRKQLLENPYDDNNVLMISNDFDEEYTDILKCIHKKYANKAVAFYGGRTRNVFDLGKGYVVKIPCSPGGEGDNDWEGSIFNGEDRDDLCAVQYPDRKRLVYVGKYKIPILFMELVMPLTGDKIIKLFGYEPDWVRSVDGGQVGVNKHGRLVAYDYGLN